MNQVESLKFLWNRNSISTVDRRSYLLKLKQSILRHENEIYGALRHDLGRPDLETYLAEIYFTILEIDTVIKNIDGWTKPQKIKTNIHNFPASSWIVPSSKGVVFVIAPWNYPFHLSLAPAIDALAAGNRVIIKPSEFSLATSALVKKIISEAIPSEIMQVVEGGKEVTQEVLNLPLDHIFFTGGYSTAKIIARKAAETLTPVTYELGGKNPCIIDRNVDLETSVKRIMMAKFFNAGQTCIAPDFIAIDSAIKNDFIEASKKTLKTFYPTQEDWNRDFAHAPFQKHYEYLQGLVPSNSWSLYDADEKQMKLAPTLATDVKWKDKIMEDEIFGPILPIVSYENISEVKEQIKDWTPLALYIFSTNRKFQDDLIINTKSGGVCINDCMKQFTNIHLPFGGIGKSGIGAYHAKAGFDTFTHYRPIVKRGFFFDKFSAYPPYKNLFGFIRKFVKSKY